MSEWKKRVAERLNQYREANPGVPLLICINIVEDQLAQQVEGARQYVEKRGHDVEANLSKSMAELLLFRTLYR